VAHQIGKRPTEKIPSALRLKQLVGNTHDGSCVTHQIDIGLVFRIVTVRFLV